jgi:hypothetical protein
MVIKDIKSNLSIQMPSKMYQNGGFGLKIIWQPWIRSGQKLAILAL